MKDNGSDKKGTLAPIYPSETPYLPDNGRQWVAIFLLIVFIRFVGRENPRLQSWDESPVFVHFQCA